MYSISVSRPTSVTKPASNCLSSRRAWLGAVGRPTPSARPAAISVQAVLTIMVTQPGTKLFRKPIPKTQPDRAAAPTSATEQAANQANAHRKRNRVCIDGLRVFSITGTRLLTFSGFAIMRPRRQESLA
ncbi:hypothetical protein D9M69_521470 [compost metagenome]